MKLVSCALSLVLLSACSYRGAPPPSDVSYTMQQGRTTTVTVHPPPPQVVVHRRAAPVEVGTATLTSASIGADGAAVGEEAEEAETSPADRHLGDTIRHALTTDKHMAGCGVEGVHLSAENHRVRLRGRVSTLADKVAIEQRVREVRGVEAVDNEIAVLR